jgi:hypothetical protein
MRDGTILFVVTMWGRVERYDSSGKFLGAWRQPFGKGRVALAVDDQDRVYLRHLRDVFRFGQNGELISKHTAGADLPKSWLLSQTGEPQYAPEITRICERRAATRGEPLFCEDATLYFAAPDGTRLLPTSHSITRISASGQILSSYHSPWYFGPVLFPLPGLLAGVAAGVLIFTKARRESTSGD